VYSSEASAASSNAALEKERVDLIETTSSTSTKYGLDMSSELMICFVVYSQQRYNGLSSSIELDLEV
jgi:hypothetical protein